MYWRWYNDHRLTEIYFTSFVSDIQTNTNFLFSILIEYRLISKKGEGTFSEVLEAQSIKNNKHVAIKCMKANFYNIEKVSYQTWLSLRFSIVNIRWTTLGRSKHWKDLAHTQT